MSHHSRTLLAGRDDRFAFAFLRPSDRGQWRGQRLDEQLVDRLDWNNLQPTLYIVGDLGEIFLVILRDQHGLQAAAKSSEKLLLEAADRQHPTAQRDLAGHRDISLYRDAAQHRDDRGHHRHAGGWAVFRRRTLRHMDVNVLLLEHRWEDAKEIAARLDETLGGLHRFLHHIAELSGRRNPPLSRDGDRLDRQQFAAHLGPGEPRGAPDQILALGLAKAELAHPGVFLQVAARHRDALGLLHQNIFDRLAGQVGDLALQIANAGLAREVADQIAYRLVADAPLVLADAMRGHLLRDQVTLCDLDLLILGVTRNADDLHAVEQWLGNA